MARKKPTKSYDLTPEQRLKRSQNAVAQHAKRKKEQAEAEGITLEELAARARQKELLRKPR